ncbi:MAG: hypothetical protein VX000_16025, partial [Myxococcota bacterium]|nr:hypothetical protein [Myxococcota bacterium]
MGLVGVLLVVGLLGMVFGIARVRSLAHGRVLQTNARAAGSTARALAGGARAEAVIAAWEQSGSAEQLVLVDPVGVVTHWGGASGTVGVPLVGELQPFGQSRSSEIGSVLVPGRGAVGEWSQADGRALAATAPIGADGGWVVVATPVRRVAALLVPAIPGAVLVLLGLVGAVTMLGASLRDARSARDLAGAVRTARTAERNRLQRVTRDLPALLFERMSFPEGGGAFTWVSPNSVEILETDATDLVVHPELLLGYVLPADIAGLRAAMGAAEDPSSHVLRWEGRMQLPSGRLRWFRAQARRVDASELGARWCGFLVDITDERSLEAQLKQRGRLATVGQLAAGVAHEINNPLSYVIGNTRFVLEAADAGEISIPEDFRLALGDA